MKLPNIEHIRAKLVREHNAVVQAPLPPVMLALLAQIKDAEEELRRSSPPDQEKK